jgi:transposase
MAYFLKQTKQNRRTYLAIYESFYDHSRKGSAHRCFRSLGSVESNIEKGISDPVAHFQNEVDRLNSQRKLSGVPKIGDSSANMYLGYFPLKIIMDKLKIKRYVDLFKLNNDFRYDLYDLLSSLVYARSVHPCSKTRTFHEVIPSLFQKYGFSYDQLLDGLSFLGLNYEKIVELFTVQSKTAYGTDTSKTFFDCTNFYFEIDQEDNLRRKGPSKENRKEPIVGLGLLLDNNQIPIGMKIYPGNESEKPLMREVIDALKRKNNITGRTIHVADKGVNCAQNIAYSRLNRDGYLFSKSVKGLPEIEREWVLLDDGFKDALDKDGKILYRYKSCADQFPYEIMHDGKPVTIELSEKRLLTYSPSLAKKKRMEISKMVDKARSLTLSQAKKEEYGEEGKYVRFTDKEGRKALPSINKAAVEKDLKFAGYNLLVTSETDMPDEDMYSTYHTLWVIEESFKIMKSDLDARPVFLQKEDSIKGHFLICYITVLLERILQYKVLDNKWSAQEIFEFIRKFRVTQTGYQYVNTLTRLPIVGMLESKFKLPITNLFLSDTQIKSILDHKI